MTVNDSPSPPETVLSETHGDPRASGDSWRLFEMLSSSPRTGDDCQRLTESAEDWYVDTRARGVQWYIYRPHGAPSRLLDTHSGSPVETETGGLYAVSKRRFILVRALPRANSTSPTPALLRTQRRHDLATTQGPLHEPRTKKQQNRPLLVFGGCRGEEGGAPWQCQLLQSAFIATRKHLHCASPPPPSLVLQLCRVFFLDTRYRES